MGPTLFEALLGSSIILFFLFEKYLFKRTKWKKAFVVLHFVLGMSLFGAMFVVLAVTIATHFLRGWYLEASILFLIEIVVVRFLVATVRSGRKMWKVAAPEKLALRDNTRSH